jgi:preprotein translocase subunit SecD
MKTHLILSLFLLVIFSAGIGCKTLSTVIAKSGTEFRIQIETNEGDKGAVVEQAIRIIQNKLNLIKLKGEAIKDPNNSNNLIVRIYGSENLERSKKFLFTTYELELRKVVSPPNPSPVQTYPTAEAAKQIAKGDQDVLTYFERFDSKEQFVIVDKSVIVNGEDIRDAQAVSRTGSQNDYLISFSLKPQAAVTFGDWTGKNIGNYVAVVLDKKVQSIAYIKSQIFDSGEITGRFSKQEAEDISMSLKS